ncbi:hypothetical protein Arcpr_1221 [Archaeoglobus profundus DSM 5631]|uniref:Uncharacterized protein n=1 Tax=Archaeoglobus profundus (strain DSM 5631 / JCM 9629 / NBRC 100127 / Av18) TaxID=572546 RepID=D2RDS9_ARCPA|nr:hypothetical protein Arcpr_1221 [Archaeoglobus profundus DSM 5631]
MDPQIVSVKVYAETVRSKATCSDLGPVRSIFEVYANGREKLFFNHIKIYHGNTKRNW